MPGKAPVPAKAGIRTGFPSGIASNKAMPGKVDTGFPSGIASNKYAGLDGCKAGWVMVTWSGKL
jgi:hypothetical protein